VPEEHRPQAPQLPAWLGFIWRCYERLQHDRPWLVSMDGARPQPIPWRDVALWAERHGLPPEDAELLDAGIRALDAAFLEWWRMDQERQAEGRRGAKTVAG
jgi:hypothetical protein